MTYLEVGVVFTCIVLWVVGFALVLAGMIFLLSAAVEALQRQFAARRIVLCTVREYYERHPEEKSRWIARFGL